MFLDRKDGWRQGRKRGRRWKVGCGCLGVGEEDAWAGSKFLSYKMDGILTRSDSLAVLEIKYLLAVLYSQYSTSTVTDDETELRVPHK